MWDFFRLAVSGIRRRRARTALTAAGIAVGIAAVVIIRAISGAGTAAFAGELDGLGFGGIAVSANAAVEGAALRSGDLDCLRRLDFVETAMPIVSASAQVTARGEDCGALLWGVDRGVGQAVSLRVAYGREISRADVAGRASVCMVDERLAKRLYGRADVVGKSVEVTAEGRRERYEVVGVVSAEGSILQSVAGSFVPDFIYAPYTNLQMLGGSDALSQITVRLKDGANPDYAAGVIARILGGQRGAPDAVRAENLVKQRDRLTHLLDIVTAALSAIGAISLIVSGLSIMNVMLAAVQERTREIGIKKAVGARSGKILLEFLLEAVLISLLGCAAGVGFGAGVSAAGASLLGLRLTLPLGWLAGVTALCVALGAAFGAYPALKAARMRPVKALSRA